MPASSVEEALPFRPGGLLDRNRRAIDKTGIAPLGDGAARERRKAQGTVRKEYFRRAAIRDLGIDSEKIDPIRA